MRNLFGMKYSYEHADALQVALPRQPTTMAIKVKVLLRCTGREKLFIGGSYLSKELQQALWDRYIAYKQQAEAYGLQPFHARRTLAAVVKVWHFGSYVVKEYRGCRRQVLQEVAILQQLHHDNIVSHLLVADQGSKVSIIMDWAGYNLREFAQQGQRQQYAESLVQHVVTQLTQTLAYLHSKGIVHCDIKPDNIGIQPDFKVKLFDWSDAVDLKQAEALSDRALEKQVGLSGTPLYMAPEALNYITGRQQHVHSRKRSSLRSILTPKLDIWGLGAVLYFLLAGRDICEDDPSVDMDMLADVMNSQSGPELPPAVQVSEAAKDFLRCCLQRNPDKRSTAAALLQHKWVQQAQSIPPQAHGMLPAKGGTELNLSL